MAELGRQNGVRQSPAHAKWYGSFHFMRQTQLFEDLRCAAMAGTLCSCLRIVGSDTL